MNFSPLIIEYLKKHGSISFSGFGKLYQKNTNAYVIEEGKNILPPGKEIVFSAISDHTTKDFISYLSQKNTISEYEVEIEIKKRILFWNATLEKEKQLYIEKIGTFYLHENELSFKGERIDHLSPEFYGLEEVTISKKRSKNIENQANKKTYSFTQSIYWIFPLLLGILGLTYFGITQPEIIFGKKSFEDHFQKKPVKKMEEQRIKKDSLKKDSVILKNSADSVTTDSLKTIIKSNKTPVKKWSSKNYPKSKWKKAKKQKNR